MTTNLRVIWSASMVNAAVLLVYIALPFLYNFYCCFLVWWLVVGRRRCEGPGEKFWFQRSILTDVCANFTPRLLQPLQVAESSQGVS